MLAIRRVVAGLGGFARTQELLACGATERMLTTAVRTGVLARARNGWYSTLEENDPRFRAVRVGGVLTGASALASMGAWRFPSDDVLHVAVRRNDARLRSQWLKSQRAHDPSVHIHWEHESALESASRWAVTFDLAIATALREEPFERAIAFADWAWRSGRLDRIDVETLASHLPPDRRRLWHWMDPRCESFLESIVRTRLRRAGFRVDSQVRLGELGRVDLVVDDSVAIEVDGYQFHRDSFEADRRRDLMLATEGRHALRLSWRLIRDDWSLVEHAVRSALDARRSHVGNSGRQGSGRRKTSLERPLG